MNIGECIAMVGVCHKDYAIGINKKIDYDSKFYKVCPIPMGNAMLGNVKDHGAYVALL
jgi:hypothetical protein